MSGALALPAAATPRVSAPSSVDVFALHSDPNSTHTIYLDFVGATVTDTFWNGTSPGGTGQAEIDVPAFNMDGEPTSWSSDEQAFIHEVWREVSEYYAIFDVDVTTEQPSAADLARSSTSDDTYGSTVVIADDPSIRTLVLPDNAPAGMDGIALVGQFGNPESDPAWVFPQISHYDPRTAARIATHEAGHRIGLQHDRTKDNFPASSVWGSIMGYRHAPLFQFSDDTTTDRSNASEIDWIGADSPAPLPFRADDYGDTVATADDLGTQPDYSLTGLIGKHAHAPRKDVDVFRVPHECAADLTASATNSGLGSPLDIRVDILNADGNQVASADPAPAVAPDSPARITGLDASATVTSAPAGDYYIRVSGTGYGNPEHGGYTDYGSIGTYSLDISGCPTQTLVTVTTAIPTTTTATVTATTTAPASAAPTATVTVTNTVAGPTATVTTTAPAATVTRTTTAPGATVTVTRAVTETVTATRATRDHAQAIDPGDISSTPRTTRSVAAAAGAGAPSRPAATAQLPETGAPSWILQLLGYGLLLLAAGAGIVLVGARMKRGPRHTP